jgi:TolB-like protein/DNA-binding winged helix-turn-helix (wHTH) protein/Tfp pilus assembly protein PilF
MGNEISLLQWHLNGDPAQRMLESGEKRGGMEQLGVLRFSGFELDSSVPELRRGGRRVHLQEVPLRVLEMLLECPDELVPREAFFARLWPDDHSGILDDNLNTAVRKLRLALNDSAHHPRFIATVPKRGYRFVAPIVRDEEHAVESTTVRSLANAAPLSAPSRSRMKLFAPLAVVAIAVAIGAAAIVLRLDGSEQVVREPRGTFSTLAVLPFVNTGSDPADEYFGNGLAEELMDRLSRAEGFRVVSRTSAFALKDTAVGAQEIGRILGADSLVEGSVRRDGDRLRISVRLVDSRDGYQLWSETYDRRMDDVFEVQDDIALSVASTLVGHLVAPEKAGELAVPAIDPLAYDSYLRGRYLWHRRTEKDARTSVEHFEKAVERAPEYAPAWSGLADAYAVLGFYDYLPPADAFLNAQKAARRTLALDPENASAEATLGYVALYYDWDLDEAEARFLQSIQYDPGDSKAHQWYANLLTAAGRFDEAAREMRTAQQLDPLSLIASAALGWARYHAGQPEEALLQYRLTLELDPNFELAYLWSAWSLEALGDYDAAMEMVNEAVSLSGGGAISVASLARLHALRGEREEAERLLAGLVDSDSYVPAYEIAKAWFALGEDGKAEQWLQRAFEQRSHSLVFLRVDPQLAAQQSDESFLRFAGQVKRLNNNKP